PATMLGWEGNLSLFGDWYGYIIQNFSNISIVRPWANNQTISAAVGKWFLAGSDPAQLSFGLPFQVFPGAFKAQALSAGALVRGVNAAALVLALIVALRTAIVWRGRQSWQHGSALWCDLCTIAILCSLIISGVSWYHAYSFLLIPLVWQCHGLLTVSATRTPSALDLLFVGTVGVFGLLHALFPRGMREFLAVYSVFLVMMTGFYVAYCVRMLRVRP